MFKLYDRVLIKSKKITGIVVDKSFVNGKEIYVIETDQPFIEDGYGGKWKLFDCFEEEIERIKPLD